MGWPLEGGDNQILSVERSRVERSDEKYIGMSERQVLSVVKHMHSSKQDPAKENGIL